MGPNFVISILKLACAEQFELGRSSRTHPTPILTTIGDTTSGIVSLGGV